MADSWIGKTLGRYRIDREVGRGGMGVVYEGRQLSLNRKVAIKVLPPSLALDEEFKQRFYQEARVIAGLTHENLVHVYDVEEVDGTSFIVMELIEGESVRELRERRGKLSPGEVCDIGIAVARALSVAHQRGIVHRDVKSHNVMVARDGVGKQIFKLMDFGIARVPSGGIRTATGAILGTPEYMAPEQAQTGELTPRTDLYSLGVMLYELATGCLPFEGGDPFSLAFKHVTEAPTRPCEHDASIPSALEAVILQAMSKDPQERQASALEMVGELQRARGPQTMDLPPTRLVQDRHIPLPPPLVVPPPPPPPPGPSPAVLPSGAAGVPPPTRLAAARPGTSGDSYAPLGSGRGIWKWSALVGGVLILGLLGWWLVSVLSPREGRATESSSSQEPPQETLGDLSATGIEPGGGSLQDRAPYVEAPLLVGEGARAEREVRGAEERGAGETRSAGETRGAGETGSAGEIGGVGETGGDVTGLPGGGASGGSGGTGDGPGGSGAGQETETVKLPEDELEQEFESQLTYLASSIRPTVRRRLSQLPFAATFRCRERVELRLGPGEHAILVNGRLLGVDSPWEGAELGEGWEPAPGIYRVCVHRGGPVGRCVRVIVEPAAVSDVCVLGRGEG